jgi:predicted secreted protein
MNWVSGVVVYILLWWWIFLMTLPFGVESVESPGKGHAPSAPAKPQLLIKAAVTSVIALILWFGINAVIGSGVISFREIANQP